ncbi:MAG TPA: hypothetical protein DHI91_02740 [Candidatus Portnoybacteria bacterium]|nr:hypothetical protein [Candidatus Portnoybacteria bacterium]
MPRFDSERCSQFFLKDPTQNCWGFTFGINFLKRKPQSFLFEVFCVAVFFRQPIYASFQRLLLLLVCRHFYQAV